jgi:hypothetical protein
MQVTPQSQIKIRLDDRVMDELKIQAANLNVSVTSLINRLLADQLFGGNYNQVGLITMSIKIDNLLSSIRNIDRKLVKISLEKA